MPAPTVRFNFDRPPDCSALFLVAVPADDGGYFVNHTTIYFGPTPKGVMQWWNVDRTGPFEGDVLGWIGPIDGRMMPQLWLERSAARKAEMMDI